MKVPLLTSTDSDIELNSTMTRCGALAWFVFVVGVLVCGYFLFCQSQYSASSDALCAEKEQIQAATEQERQEKQAALQEIERLKALCWSREKRTRNE